VKCAELEVVLCDYADGVLGAAERTAVETHLSGCPACTELLHDMRAAVAFIGRVESPEPPPELLTRIMYHAPVSGELVRPAAGGQRRGFGSWFRGWFLQPRFVMGMAMTMLSFSMVAKIMGIPQRPPTMADLEPARVWAAVDDKLHRTWDRAVKYYENLRLVWEIQARLREWTVEEESERRAQSGGALEPSAGAPASGSTTTPSSNEASGSDQGKQKGSAQPEGGGGGPKGR
jgi:hypothetical protein